MEIAHYTGGQAGRTEVDPSFLGDAVKTRTLRQAITMYEANKRVGTHKTKTRAEIARSKKSLFKQKGTGRARVKHPQVSQCRGGGVAHGPRPRDYSWSMPKKALKVALRSALLSKFQAGSVVLADELGITSPKTKTVAELLGKLGLSRSVLIVDVSIDQNLLLATRNLQRVSVCAAQDLNAYDVIRCQNLLLTNGALEALKEAFGNES